VSERFVLITGRTRDQGKGLHQGKNSPAYRRATSQVIMSAQDMARLDIEQGQKVLLRTRAGQVEAYVGVGECPEGQLFIALGAVANALVGSDTDESGMPRFKGLDVELETP
jgi:formylmethanofuran dehydrogenase subunit D